MTMAWSPICLKAAYDPRAKPAFTGTPFTVTLRSVRGMPMRKTSPACICPDLPSTCSTAFQSICGPRGERHGEGGDDAAQRDHVVDLSWLHRGLLLHRACAR